MSAGRRAFVAAVLVVLVAIAAGWWAWTSRSLERPLTARWEAVVASAASSTLSDPFGVAVAPDGSLLVTEGIGAHRVTRISPDGKSSILAGGVEGFADGPATEARFRVPSGVAVGPDGVAYVADTGNNAIRRVTPDGVVTTLAGPGLGLNGPVGVAVDGRGFVVVADTYNDRIVLITSGGALTTLAGSGRPGFADGAADTAQFDTPTGVAIDAGGNIYVADAANGAVRVISVEGLVTTIAPGFSDAPLLPIGITVASDHSVFVTDERGRVIEVMPSGGQRTVAGSRPGFANGPGGQAMFRAPAGIAMVAPGRLVVADRRNALVRRVTAESQVEFRPPAPPFHPSFDEAALDRQPLLWPFAPIEGPFEVTGTLGEPRGSEGSERLHAGLDVHAPEGSEVRVVHSAHVADPLAASDFESINESVRIGPIAYIHMRVGRDHRGNVFGDERFVVSRDDAGRVMRVRAKRGAFFAAGDVIGTVNRFYHAHLTVGWPGEELNPLRFTLLNFVDSVPPVIAPNGVRILGEDGQWLTKRHRGRLLVNGRVRIAVDAWDQVDGNLPRRRLGLYRLGYRVLDTAGRPLPAFEGDGETLRFDRHLSESDAARVVYAPGSGIPVYGNRSSRFLYLVTSRLRDGVASDATFDASAFAPGDYTLRILAADIRGNEAVRNRDLPVTIGDPASGSRSHR